MVTVYAPEEGVLVEQVLLGLSVGVGLGEGVGVTVGVGLGVCFGRERAGVVGMTIANTSTITKNKYARLNLIFSSHWLLIAVTTPPS
jgi:hypothetical protein